MRHNDSVLVAVLVAGLIVMGVLVVLLALFGNGLLAGCVQ